MIMGYFSFKSTAMALPNSNQNPPKESFICKYNLHVTNALIGHFYLIMNWFLPSAVGIVYINIKTAFKITSEETVITLKMKFKSTFTALPRRNRSK